MMQNYIPQFYDATLYPSIVLHLPNNSAGQQAHTNLPHKKLLSTTILPEWRTTRAVTPIANQQHPLNQEPLQTLFIMPIHPQN